MAKACNAARNGHDVQDSWDSVLSIVDQYGANIMNFAEVAGPGFWNDPDMVQLLLFTIGFCNASDLNQRFCSY